MLDAECIAIEKWNEKRRITPAGDISCFVASIFYK